MKDKGNSDEISDRNEDYVIRNQKKSDLGYKVAKNLAELYLCSSVLWKVKLVIVNKVMKFHVVNDIINNE